MISWPSRVRFVPSFLLCFPLRRTGLLVRSWRVSTVHFMFVGRHRFLSLPLATVVGDVDDDEGR